MKNKMNLKIAVLALVFLAGCGAPASTPQATVKPEQTIASTQVGLPNPASDNCVAQGGQLSIETRGDGGQFGVCYFEDNQQCEEWALLRGLCPVGGIKVTGYVTQAARYCAISGGTYQITGDSNTDNEQGTCTFPNGNKCDVWEYYNGKCSGN